MKILLSLLFLSAVVVAGCANKEHVNSNSMRLNTAETITISDFETMVVDLIKRMQDDGAFKEQVVLNKNKKPSLQIDSISNFSNRRSFLELGLVREYLLKTLQETGLFEITDDANSRESVSETLVESITKNVEDGLKNDDNVQVSGIHKSADYQMYGIYRSFQDGDRHTYELTLQLIDIKTGFQVWSDIAEITKE